MPTHISQLPELDGSGVAMMGLDEELELKDGRGVDSNGQVVPGFEADPDGKVLTVVKDRLLRTECVCETGGCGGKYVGRADSDGV